MKCKFRSSNTDYRDEEVHEEVSYNEDFDAGNSVPKGASIVDEGSIDEKVQNQSSIVEETAAPPLQQKNTFAKPSFMIKKKF